MCNGNSNNRCTEKYKFNTTSFSCDETFSVSRQINSYLPYRFLQNSKVYNGIDHSYARCSDENIQKIKKLKNSLTFSAYCSNY